MLELLKFSTVPLLCMIENMQKEIDFYRRALKINAMATAWDANDTCDEEIILDAMKHPNGFRFLNSTWRNDDLIASQAIELYLENVFFADYVFYYLRDGMVEKN